MATSPYDVTLAVPEESVTLKLKLYRPERSTGARTAPPLRIEPQPLREGEQFYRQEQRATYNDASGGAGYGERVAENVYHQGLPVDARMPGLILPPGLLTEVSLAAVPITGPIYDFIDAFWVSGVHTFAVGGRYCARMAAGTGTPELFRDLGASFVAQSVVDWYGNLIIGGTGAPIWRFNTGSSTWTQSADVWRQYLATVQWERGGVNLPRLVGSTSPAAPGYTWPDRSIEYTDNADPIAESSWSDEIFVGNTGHSITGIVASNRHVYYLKSNGLYDMDDRLYSPNITEYRKHVTDILNPMPVWLNNGRVYFGSRMGLDQVPIEQEGRRQDNPTRCEFGAGTSNYGQIRGWYTAGIADTTGHGGMWAVAWNPTNSTSYLLWAKDWNDVQGVAAPDVRGPLLWHGAFAVLPSVQILSLHLSTPSGASYAPRLWLGGYDVNSGLAKLYWMSLPLAGSPYQDLLLGGPMRFADQMVIDFPRETYGSDVSRKDLTRISIRGDNLGTATLAAYMMTDGAQFGATLPDTLGQSSAAYEEFSVTTSSNVRDQTFRVVGRGTATAPPILRALEAQSGVSVEANTVQTWVCTFADDEDRRSKRVIEALLDACRAKRGTITDHRRNRVYDGRVLQDLSLAWEESQTGEREGRWIVTIPFLATTNGWRLDEGHSFDTGLRLG